ncbi:type V secretion protein A [Enterobacterales bacterium CwR94]|nr:type V secretion protein A [Enterobacterales bacterium CwR94]
MTFFKKSVLATSLTVAFSSSAFASISTSGNTNTPLNGENIDSPLVVIIGADEEGTLNIDNGSTLTSKGGLIGFNGDGIGSVTVDGERSSWDSSRNIIVGDYGKGTLIIKNGASVYSSGMNSEAFAVGRQAGSEGHVIISDATYDAVSGNIFVGTEGKGTLDIINGGGVSTANDLLIAHNGDSQGTVNVRGAGSNLLVTKGVMYLASSGNEGNKKGTLNITEGGSASTIYAYVGNGANGSGHINVDGMDSVLNVGASIYAGREGEGHVTVTNGGTVNAKNVIVASGAPNISKGTVTVAGPDSSLNVEDIRVGYGGTGSLIVADNASVNGRGNTYIGDNGIGDIRVTDNAVFNTKQLMVGGDGSGALRISDGAKVNTSGVSIGASYSNEGTDVVTVKGPGSSLTTDLNSFGYGAIFVGIGKKSGVLTVSDDATVNTQQLSIGTYPEDGAISSLNIGAEKGQAAEKAGYITQAYIDLASENAEVNFNHTNDDYVFDRSIQGAGSINQIAGLTRLTGNNHYFTGITNVLGGVLSSSVALGGDVNISEQGTLVASGAISGNVENKGVLKIGKLTDAGMEVGETASLTVGGDYAGNNGAIIFDTVLNDDLSDTDRLSIQGDTSGSTQVRVNNMGGTGAQTLEGIQLISVNGRSEGEFVQQGRIAAGAFDYQLVRGSSEALAKNWYLTSALAPVTEPEPEAKPDPKPEEKPEPGTQPDPQPEVKPGLKPEIKPEIKPETKPEIKPTPDPKPEGKPDLKNSAVRPEAGAYIANLAAANTLFNTRLHDRLGETHYVDALTGQTEVSSMWMRHEGGRNSSTDSAGQLKTTANRYVMQLGGDIAQWTSHDGDRFHLGVMAGYANQKGKTRNSLTGYSAKGNIDGYSTGVYGTWLQDNANKTGAYVDSWLQYSWFNNSVNGDGLAAERYKSKGLTASVESGYTFKLGELSNRDGVYLQPKGQMTWMGVKADDHREDNGTQVRGQGDENVQTRLGVKAFIKHENHDQTFEPFVEANWLHNTKAYGVRLDDVNIHQVGARNVGELKAGVEGKVHRNVNLWGNVAQQIGDKGYSDTAATLGVKVNF